MLRGGVTKVDVDKMREKLKEGGKRKEVRQKTNEAPIDHSQESKIKALVDSILAPEIHRLEQKIDAAVASVKEVSSNAVAYQASVVGSVDTILQSFKTEILSYFSKATTQPAVEVPDAIPVTNEVVHKVVCRNSTPADFANGVESRDDCLNTTPGPVIGVVESRVLPENILSPMRESNDQIIDNVLENLSNYSTPPRSAKQCQGSEAESHRQRSPLSAGGHPEDSQRKNETSSIHSKKRMSAKQLSKELSEGSATYHISFPRKVRSAGNADAGISQHASVCGLSQTPQQGGAVDVFLQHEIPSFSLGLTQELGIEQRQEAGDMGHNNNIYVEEPIEAVVCDNEETLSCRKSKRRQHVPPQLITDYQCGTPIVNRAREGQLLGMIGVINVGGLSVTGKDMVDIGERNRFLPGRVIDILTRVVAFNVNNEALGSIDTIPVFLDSRVQVLLGRNYPKFKKSKRREKYVFTKGVVDCVRKSSPRDIAVARWYIPFNVHRRHWVGLCVYIPSSKIYVLDCNQGLITDEALVKELLPISDMFPYILRRLGNVVPTIGNKLAVERIKGVAQNTNPADAALTACLLIQAHALFGFDGCRSITPTVIPVEAQKAAIMVYEFHQKL
ncbi:hypothetical protein IGI04_002006 [Brassica rapa subsp. trilocularis]|uniref:Ubiquitin-like protease family profile domain-containing protein n=1 Tax=Brassica rapa subsp. trilocularis TaxID=1813537 RepID=A0ABQ7NU91_BRACM|nr:hypothetical protein IGI04_002006 [Brassica rapa subsp. trilocularis]